MHDYYGSRFFGENKVILLSKDENKILDLLLINKKAISYEKICKTLYEKELNKRLKQCVICKINRLRKKLKNEVEIKSIRGYGIVLS